MPKADAPSSAPLPTPLSRLRRGAVAVVVEVIDNNQSLGDEAQSTLARRLMEKLVFRQMRRGETPFLHVMSGNANARELYARMGFRDYREAVVRVVAPA